MVEEPEFAPHIPTYAAFIEICEKPGYGWSCLQDDLNRAFAEPRHLMDWRDWVLVWTGWKGRRLSAQLTSQWVALKKDQEVRYYSSTPGGVGRIGLWESCNVEPQPYQLFLTPSQLIELDNRTLWHLAGSAKIQAWEKLLEVMREKGERV